MLWSSRASVITAIGILMTEWRLDTVALITVALTFALGGIGLLPDPPTQTSDTGNASGRGDPSTLSLWC